MGQMQLPATARSISSLAMRCLLGAALCLALAACRPSQDTPDLFDQATASKAIAALKQKVGETGVRALKVEIQPDRIVLQVQDPKARSHVDVWTYSISDFLYGHWRWEDVSGPTPVALNLINPDLEQNLFNLSDVDFSALGGLAVAAIKRAGLEDRAEVTGMSIERQLYLIPSPSSGDVKWTVEINSGREQATINATAKGVITGANLAGTNRARTLDMLQGGEPLRQAVADIRLALGTGPVIRRFMFSRSYVWFNGRDPREPSKPADFTWDLNGLRKSAEFIPIPLSAQSKEPLFGIDDVDWTLLPKLKELAKTQLGMPEGVVTDIKIEKPSNGVGDPVPLWQLEVIDRNRDKGTVLMDTRGAIRQTLLPEGRRVRADMFDGATIEQALATIGKEFGPAVRILEITFDRERMTVTADDPRKPGSIASFLYDKGAFDRLSSPMTAVSDFKPDWLFTLQEARPVAAPLITGLKAQTLARLKLDGAVIDRITLSRSKLFHPQNKALLLEIRIEAENELHNGKHGWILYDLAGKSVDVMTP
jgi:hypothetical protein